MEIYLIRHTTPNVQKGICYGQSDLEVTASFATEADHIHQQLAVQEISKVYSSPLIRCKRLAETFKKEVVFDDRLKELDFGKWELCPWDDINEKELKPWMNDFVNIKVPEGESYLMLQQRAIDFFSTINQYTTTSEKIVVVTHAGWMRAIMAYIQKIDLKDSFAIELQYGHIVTIQYIDNQYQITSGLNQS
ncbi:alpha-ribazole phosphatase [Aquimarina algicola]|uniref:Alpha-ribazole phosphatase n=1 Tax=Aquimarina algicola TaxID=2589995 RepID=A0A504IWA3_9FLAO|nr:alpha-ribazole phosphatase [Aquimarina algicola]TPN82304.1 alpha-ribazole phosphatase [Aquimarina algicola]